MIYRNKNFHTFFSLAAFLGAIVVTATQKSFPLFHHTLYYCQTFIRSLSIHIPYQISRIFPIMLVVLLGIASLKLLFVFIQTYHLRKKLVSQSTQLHTLQELLAKLELTQKTYIVENDKPFAYCFGVRNPKIYISTATVSLMNNKELEAIFLHEKYHIDNKDTFTMLLASICQSLFPFFPLLTDLLHNYRIEREIKADQNAIDKLGSSQPLISVLRKLLIQPSFVLSNAPAIADHDTLEPRIKVLMKKDFEFKKFRRMNIFLSLISVFVLLFIVLSPVHAIEVHESGEDFMMVCPSGKECVASCTEQIISKAIQSPQLNASYLFTPSR